MNLPVIYYVFRERLFSLYPSFNSILPIQYQLRYLLYIFKIFLVFCTILQYKILKQHEVSFFLLWLNYFFRKINRLKIGKYCVRCIIYAFILFPFYFEYLCIADALHVDVYSDFLQCYIQTFFSCWIFLYIFSKRGTVDY